MNEYIKMAHYLTDFAELINGKNISMKSIDFRMIIEPIKKVYDGKYGANNEYSDFFPLLIEAGDKLEDKKFIVEALRYIAKDMERVERLEIMYRSQQYKLFSELGYYKNLIRNLSSEDKSINKNRFEGRGVIYSAITGNYDDVKEPEYISEDMDYILFTNNPNIKSEIWKIHFIDNPEELDNVRLARKIKIMGHEILKDYDYSIWIDGKLKIKGDLKKYVETNRGDNGILCFNHFFNNCIYEEWGACTRLNKDDPEIMQKQMERYKSEGYPEQNGLIESGLLVRDLRDMKVQETMELWWNEVLNGSRRDQLSFNYACWKNKQNYDTTKIYLYMNEYVELYAHNN